MPDYTEMGRRMAERRAELGLRLADVAEAVGVAPSTILRYEKGNFQKVKQPVIDSIAAALHVSPAYLTGEREDLTPEDGPTELDVKAAFFRGADPSLTPAEWDELWGDAQRYIRFMIGEKKKRRPHDP